MSDTGPMTLCLFHCGNLTGEIGNWSRERDRASCSLLVLLWSATQDQWISLCFIVVISLGKKETGPVSSTGPIALWCHCGHLNGEIGNWSREHYRTNGSVCLIVVISLEK